MAFLVMQRGKILYEFYSNGMMSSTPHILCLFQNPFLGSSSVSSYKTVRWI